MAVKEKNDPQKGEFIDLEKTEFKKKSNFFTFFLKSLFLIFANFNFTQRTHGQVVRLSPEVTEVRVVQVLPTAAW